MTSAALPSIPRSMAACYAAAVTRFLRALGPRARLGRHAAGREEAADHRRADAAVDRLRRRALRAGARRRDRAHELRPDREPHAEDREAAARARATCSSWTPTTPSQIDAVREELASRWGRVDGMLHAIAFAPQDALGGNFLHTRGTSVATAIQTSTFSLKALAVGMLPLMEADGGSIVSLDFDAQVAWPIYDWMGVAKAGLEAVTRYLARDLGPTASASTP